VNWTNTQKQKVIPTVRPTKRNSNMNPEWDLLLSAAQKNRPDLIRELCGVGGVDPSHANAVGQSALHIAALWGHGMYLSHCKTVNVLWG
jgi:ankyrin repeat protein